MRSKNENFHETGPKHLTAMDWKNTDHKRSVVASLVQGVYSLELDRLRKKYLGRHRKDNVEPWWTSFNFHLHETLIDYKQRIFGATYKYNGKYASADSDVPEYVIAFRGTLLRPGTGLKDIKLIFKCFFNELEESSRFKLALNYVERFVEAKEARNVWLAGHSSGSVIALLVGKKMILKMEWFPKAYLFNPPFLSFPIELLEDKKVKKIIRCAHRLAKAGLIFLAPERSKHRMVDRFDLLSSWTPHLFVNPADIFCAAYIAYFESKVGAGETMTLAENNSMRNLVSHVVFRKDLKDATHLLPSAHLIVNESHPNKKAADNSTYSDFREAHTISQWYSDFREAHTICQWYSDFREAHTISQWWRPGVRCQSTLYQQS